MIISHCHKFIFIKTPKTAGTSIQEALNKITCPEDVIIGNDRNQNTKGFKRTSGGHQSLSKAFLVIPECRDYFVITAERNPWDRMVSAFFWSNKKHNLKNNSVQKNTVILNEWLQGKRAESFSSKIYGQPDFVIQYHTLNEDWSRLGKCLQLDLPPVGIYHIGIRPKKSYTLFYDDKTRDLVAKQFAAEIEAYGYIFGGQDTHL
jgi:hypothetical protein